MSKKMLVDVTLADVGEGIAEAQIVEWLVAPGQAVNEDQPIVLISTDKAMVELPAPTSGVLFEQLVSTGTTVTVGSLIARIEAPPELAAKAMLNATASQFRSVPQPAAKTSTVMASPSARLLARQLDVDLKNLCGSGPQGRILEDDIRREASRSSSQGTGRQESEDRRSPAEQGEERVSLGGIRLAIARSTTSAWRDVPHIIEFRQIDATNLQEVRRLYRAHFEHEGTHLTFLPLFLKAAAVTLAEHPRFNARFDTDKQEVIYHRHCNIGIATATEAGLTVPVLCNAEQLPLLDIARTLGGLIDRARKQNLSVADTTKGTFTITNFGSYGTWLGTPIIRAPEVAILGFGRIQDAVLAVDGVPVVRPVLPICAATDHRLNDGIHLAAFLDTLTKVLLDPGILCQEP
jgi:pyruvate dehydrogenase E2 component (dihydrolipoamide acetyltransferase)